MYNWHCNVLSSTSGANKTILIILPTGTQGVGSLARSPRECPWGSLRKIAAWHREVTILVRALGNWTTMAVDVAFGDFFAWPVYIRTFIFSVDSFICITWSIQFFNLFKIGLWPRVYTCVLFCPHFQLHRRARGDADRIMTINIENNGLSSLLRLRLVTMLWNIEVPVNCRWLGLLMAKLTF